MKALTLALLLCLPLPKLTPPPRAPNDHISQVTRKGGRWYFAATGHAVYCYGTSCGRATRRPAESGYILSR